MGHERVGVLPKSDRWRKIVSDIAHLPESNFSVENIVEKTAQALNDRLRRLHLDEGIQDVFTFLLILSISAKSNEPTKYLSTYGFDLGGKPATPLFLAHILSSYSIHENASQEYFELAKNAAIRTLADYYSQESRQQDIFYPVDDPFIVWRKTSDGSGFCVFARKFFTHLTSSYIRYFLDREASVELPTIEERERFQNNLKIHIERMNHHSFETSKITQSFTAGWYNKYTKEGLPERDNILSFLQVAFNKIRDSLNREDAI